MKSPKKTVSRRKFIKKSSLLSTVPVIAAGLPTSSLANVQDTNQFLRLRWIGVGKRGTLMSLPGRTAIHEKRVVEWKEVTL